MIRSSAAVLLLVSGCLLAFPTWPTSAATHVVEAGKTHTLMEDLVLTGDDVLEVKGTAEKPCTIVGNNHRIHSEGKWSGSVKITHCTLRKLGARAKSPDDQQRLGTETHAFDLKAAGKGSITIEHCTFDESSSVQIQNDERSATSFRNNTVLDNSLVAIDKDIAKSAHCFVARGNSKERKLFQGNFIPRGKVVFQAPNWLVGGDTDADSNILIGLRIGILAEGEATIVRGNYLHLRMPITKEYPYWSQISTFTTAKGALGEHNVIRDGEWIVRFVEGEFRYNIIMDIIDHDLMQNGSAGRVHHNLFLVGDSDHRQGSMSGCIAVVYPPKNPGEGIEAFNNVFDGGGKLDVPAIEVAPKGFVKSVRNNVFYDFAHKEKYYKGPHAMIRTAWNDEPAEELPARLGYADYNLFYSPNAKAKRNYLLGVAGKTLRKDAGFGLNDVPKGGKVDEQVDPKFKGPIPKRFPFTDDDIKARKVTVSKILAFYRDAYSPAEGSPLIGAGDPADGDGTNIGAIGAAKPSALDRFGRFGAK
jgi:hypothetical protein